jgi:anti-sigma B factor antagonist
MDTATTVVVRAGKTLDACTAGTLRTDLREAVGRLPAEVVADLRDTEFMDATGLAVLVGALRYARAHDVRLVVACAREPVLKVIRITGLTRVLDVRDGLEETPGA